MAVSKCRKMTEFENQPFVTSNAVIDSDKDHYWTLSLLNESF